MQPSITFVIGPFGTGGGERNCFNLANAFVAKGIQVTVVTLKVKHPDYLKRFDPRVKIIDLKQDHLRHALPQLFAFIRTEKPTKVLAFNHYVATALQLIRSYPGIQFELYMRNIIGLTHKYSLNQSLWQGKISKIFVQSTLKKLDGIVSQCQDMAQDLEKNWSVSSKRLRVIYNPVSTEVEARQSSFHSKSTKVNVLHVGRLSPEKRIDLLLQAISQIPEVELNLLGEGTEEAKLRSLAKELGLEKRVHFLGFIADPIPFYQRAHVTALTSFSEGFPNVLIESLTLGTPIVAFDCPTGPREIIDEGQNGFLIKLGDINTFTLKLKEALEKKWDFSVTRYRQGPIIDQYLEFLKL